MPALFFLSKGLVWIDVLEFDVLYAFEVVVHSVDYGLVVFCIRDAVMLGVIVGVVARLVEDLAESTWHALLDAPFVGGLYRMVMLGGIPVSCWSHVIGDIVVAGGEEKRRASWDSKEPRRQQGV